ncbi:2421_t:CDS:2, partial [Acaulospora colombiana]
MVDRVMLKNIIHKTWGFLNLSAQVEDGSSSSVAVDSSGSNGLSSVASSESTVILDDDIVIKPFCPTPWINMPSEPSTPAFKVYTCTHLFLNQPIHFQITTFEESAFVWVGAEGNEVLGNLAVAMPPPVSKNMSSATTIMTKNIDESSKNLGCRLDNKETMLKSATTSNNALSSENSKINFEHEISHKFFRAISCEPLVSEQSSRIDDVPDFIKQTGTTKILYDTPHKLLNTPPSPYDLTIASLLRAGLHIGHSKSLWDPTTSPFIFGIRHDISIINLEYTLIYLRRACKVIREMSYRGGIILFVNTRGGGFTQATINAAKRCKQYQLTTRWLPGTLTNSQQILGHLTKKDDKDLLAKVYTPDLIVLLNPVENEIVLREARQSNVPTIGIVDTDFNPTKVTWPIPANDDSVRGVELIAGVLSVSARDGLLHRYK